MEMLEYFDENNIKALGTAERDYIHKNNLWHREISIWVMNENDEVLFQKRSPLKKQYPNKYAVCSGHIDINENPKTAAIRELKEETGIITKEKDLINIDTYINVQEENNHFKYTYLIFTNKKIEDMTKQEEEVSELKFITLNELERLINTQDDMLTFSKKHYAKPILSFLKKIAKDRKYF